MKRSAMSNRTRFEVFKRDDFTCRYCGGKSPDVVLEVDHIVPVAEGGSDDPMNLATSCWACNSGKSAVPLDLVMTGDDPHDKAILLLERERQLREYNSVLAVVNERIESDLKSLRDYWNGRLTVAEETGLENYLKRLPAEVIRRSMLKAMRAGRDNGLAFVYHLLNKELEVERV